MHTFICTDNVRAAHQFHQLFGLADLLWDGHKLVVAHKQNFEGEAEQVFWQNWQEISAAEEENIDLHLKQYPEACNSEYMLTGNWVSAKEEVPLFHVGIFALLVYWKGNKHLLRDIKLNTHTHSLLLNAHDGT